MSLPSSWPLSPGSIRFILPTTLVDRLAAHPLCHEIYPKSIGHYRRARGHKIRRDLHDDWLLMYVIEGRASLFAGGREATVGGGDLIGLPNGAAHSYSSSDKDPWTTYWMHFAGHAAQAFFEQAFGTAQATVKHIGARAPFIAEFKRLLEARTPALDLPSFVHAANVLRQMLTYVALLPSAAELPGKKLDLAQVHSIMAREVDLDLATLAARVGMSKYRFAKSYRRLTGTSPMSAFHQSSNRESSAPAICSTRPQGLWRTSEGPWGSMTPTTSRARLSA